MGQMQINQQPVVGLDIGSSKVVAMAGRINELGENEIFGMGCAESKGFSHGTVVNIADATESITEAVRDLEFMAKIEIGSVFVGVTGKHVRSCNSRGISAIEGGVVLEDDINRALAPAQVVPNSERNQRVLHILPQEYIIDEQRGLSSPEGMEGTKLEAKVHVVVCDNNIVKNVERSVHNANLDIDGLVQSSMATSYATLSPDEKMLGVCLIDIGAGTTDIAIYYKGALRHTWSIPLGGRDVSNDIALVLQCRAADAERLKLEYGTSYSESIRAGEVLRMKHQNDDNVFSMDRQLLSKIIESRYQEFLELARKDIQKHGHDDHIPSGIVLTGGASRIEGIKLLAEKIFQKQVRIAKPAALLGLNEIIGQPACSTGAGVLLHGLDTKRQAMGCDEGVYAPPMHQRMQRLIDRLF